MSIVHSVAVSCVASVLAVSLSLSFPLSLFCDFIGHYTTFVLIMPETRSTARTDSLPVDDDQFPEFREIIKKEFAKMKTEFQKEMCALVKETICAEFRKLEKKVMEQEIVINQLKKAFLDSEMNRLREKRSETASNLILSGLPEAADEAAHDLTAKTTSVLRHLDPKFNGSDMKTMRIGRESGDHPRKVKISMKLRVDRNNLLRNARQLRTYPNGGKSLFLDADRPFLDRKEGARLRAKSRDLRNEHPDKEIMIKKGKLLVDGLVVDSENPLRHIFPLE